MLDLLTRALATRSEQEAPPKTRRRALLLQIQAVIEARVRG